jgi:hypothetical protein
MQPQTNINTLIKLAHGHPTIAAPVLVEALYVLLAYLASKAFGTFFTQHLVPIGHETSLMALGIFVLAVFNDQSCFARSYGRYGGTTLLLFVMFMAIYIFAYKCTMYFETNSLRERGWFRATLGIFAMFSSWALGALAFVLATNLNL